MQYDQIFKKSIVPRIVEKFKINAGIRTKELFSSWNNKKKKGELPATFVMYNKKIIAIFSVSHEMKQLLLMRQIKRKFGLFKSTSSLVIMYTGDYIATINKLSQWRNQQTVKERKM